MKYSIQNSFGEVYGMYPMPSTDKSPVELAEELTTELGDILGFNGVNPHSSLRSSRTEVPEERVVIDIEHIDDIDTRLDRVHATVGKIATRHQEE